MMTGSSLGQYCELEGFCLIALFLQPSFCSQLPETRIELCYARQLCLVCPEFAVTNSVLLLGSNLGAPCRPIRLYRIVSYHDI